MAQLWTDSVGYRGGRTQLRKPCLDSGFGRLFELDGFRLPLNHQASSQKPFEYLRFAS